MQIEYLIFLGIIISIFASTFYLPLRPNRLVSATFLGTLGSLVGGVLAHLLVDIRLIGMPISSMTIIIGIVMLIILQRKQIEKVITFLKGGEKYVRWNIH